MGLTHAENLASRIRGADLVAVTTSSAERAYEVRRRCSAVSVHDDLGSLLEAERLDAAQIEAIVTTVDIKDLIEYADDEGFRSFVDWENCPYPDSPSEFGAMSVAGLGQALQMYKGIFNDDAWAIKRLTVGELRKDLFSDTEEFDDRMVTPDVEGAFAIIAGIAHGHCDQQPDGGPVPVSVERDIVTALDTIREACGLPESVMSD